MSDDEALFDVFEENGGGGSRTSKATAGTDKMAKLEAEKQSGAKALAAELLQSMLQGGVTPAQPPSTKRQTQAAEKDGPSLAKKPRDEDESKDIIAVSIDDGDDLDAAAIVGAEEFGTLESLPRIQVHRLETEEKCTHEVALPHGMEYTALKVPETEPAQEYEFVLDPFQKEAILCLDNYQSVLVSAHTSAGKTVVALYAIAMSLRDKQRVIYTTPIKALSNQKFRELQEEFKDVGLMTGDVTLNPDASCLVMTTEILRSMLYRGSEIMREVGWVVFDEIHYMRDKERGVVWEETIILLPDNVHYVFLSATIPNARQFAEWVCFLHNQPCHVVYTDYRPTPLQHFIYPAGGDGLYEVVNINNEFREDKFMQAMSGLKDTGDGGRGGVQRGKRGGTRGESNVVKIIRTIKDRDMVPCIVFSFSRKDCEAYATSMKDMDFNDETSKEMVLEIYNNAMDLLSEDDRKLPQIDAVLPFLLRGIGIHHSGLLPILKETIEILFGEGLIKTLFATETFSMGLNMPARTVLFTSARKFDGKDYRWLTSGEYIQMSGRAGRRGKDDKGLVILMVDQQMGADVAKQIVRGTADPINSQFRLTYNMVLNLLRVEGINPEYMLERSFYQFQNYAALPELYANVKRLEMKCDDFNIENELEVAGYYQMEKQIEMLRGELRKIINKPKHLIPFLAAGRLLKIEAGDRDFGWASLVNYHRKVNPKDPLKAEMIYILDVAMVISPESAKDPSNVGQLRPPDAAKGQKGVVEIVPLTTDCVAQVSAARIKLPQDLKSFEARQSVARIIQALQRRFPDGMPPLDPIKDMQIKDKALEETVKRLQSLELRRKDHPLGKTTNFNALYATYQEKLAAEADLKAAKAELKKAKSLLQLDELKCRKRVLRRIGYCDESDVITRKGRVACEISAADELLITEMLFGGVFNELTAPQAAALLSTFVFQENAESGQLADDLSGCLRSMQQYARRIAKVTAEAKLEIDEDAYVESFRPHLMDVVHSWCSGATFAEILKKTDVFEGSIIRALRRLEELLREMVNASKSIENKEMEAKFEEARTRLKRDIVFAASLYL
uniref:Superkiller viralicidic activity 2-like 2 n=1 Tax=Plectus sambesii TaxID=2011161 RepID=A0A914W8B0_9BILA